MSVISMSPFKCRMWSQNDRLESQITESSCRNEIQSFTKHGQLIPVMGRPIKNDPNYEIELIYGARRLFIARHLNHPLAIEVRELSDREAFIAMDIENRHRRDISPYERGLSYARWLRGKYFQSQDDISRALRISPSQVSRLLKLARLPSVVVEAFRNPSEICEGWGIEIMEFIDDPLKRSVTIARARALKARNPRLTAKEVYQTLLSGDTRARRLRPKGHDEVIKGVNGLPLFRIKFQTGAVAIILPQTRLTSAVLDEIKRFLIASLASGH